MKNKFTGIRDGLNNLNPTYISQLERDKLINLIFRLKEENLLFRKKLQDIHSMSYDIKIKSQKHKWY